MPDPSDDVVKRGAVAPPHELPALITIAAYQLTMLIRTAAMDGVRTVVITEESLDEITGAAYTKVSARALIAE